MMNCLPVCLSMFMIWSSTGSCGVGKRRSQPPGLLGIHWLDKIAGQHSLNYPPSFLFRYLERLLRSLVYLPIQRIFIKQWTWFIIKKLVLLFLGKQFSADDAIKIQLELLDLKAEKQAMAMKIRSMAEEKKQLQHDMNELFKRQKEELEIQQLQHLQTFRVYRETFEDQKAALEQRWGTVSKTRLTWSDCLQIGVVLAMPNDGSTIALSPNDRL